MKASHHRAGTCALLLALALVPRDSFALTACEEACAVSDELFPKVQEVRGALRYGSVPLTATSFESIVKTFLNMIARGSLWDAQDVDAITQRLVGYPFRLETVLLDRDGKVRGQFSRSHGIVVGAWLSDYERLLTLRHEFEHALLDRFRLERRFHFDVLVVNPDRGVLWGDAVLPGAYQQEFLVEEVLIHARDGVFASHLSDPDLDYLDDKLGVLESLGHVLWSLSGRANVGDPGRSLQVTVGAQSKGKELTTATLWCKRWGDRFPVQVRMSHPGTPSLSVEYMQDSFDKLSSIVGRLASVSRRYPARHGRGRRIEALRRAFVDAEFDLAKVFFDPIESF